MRKFLNVLALTLLSSITLTQPAHAAIRILVPEPITTTLFIVGGGTILAVNKLRKKN